MKPLTKRIKWNGMDIELRYIRDTLWYPKKHRERERIVAKILRKPLKTK